MHKHSAGNWERDGYYGCDSIYAVYEDSITGEITRKEICFSSGLPNIEENEANINLILAAPDLLKVATDMDDYWHILHTALKRVDQEGVRNAAIDLLNELQDKARSAIRKAEGEEEEETS